MKLNNFYGDTQANAGIQIVTYDIKNKLTPKRAAPGCGRQFQMTVGAHCQRRQQLRAGKECAARRRVTLAILVKFHDCHCRGRHLFVTEQCAMLFCGVMHGRVAAIDKACA